MRKSTKLETLRLKYPVHFTTTEAASLQISPQLLKYFLTKGHIERASHGVYRFPNEWDMSLEFQIKEILKAVPHGIISHKTALRLYGLTEEAPAQIDLIVSDKNIPKRKLEDVCLHPLAKSLIKNGITRLNGMHITSLERTLIDLLRNGEPMSFVIATYKEAQSKKLKPSLTRLKTLGKQLHAKAKIKLFLEALL